MIVEVILYGGLRHRAGKERFSLEMAEGATVGELLEAVRCEEESLSGALGSVACALGEEIVSRDEVLFEGAKVALLPPVSGGSGEKRGGRGEEGGEESPWLSPAPLELERLLEETADRECGGLVIFSGDIRRSNAGREDVIAMEYEAHGPIAARVLREIEEEICARFEVRRCRIQHRLGRVELGESSVLVVCRAVHRDAAFRGARYGIDELKERAPIWKKEHYSQGSPVYLDGTPLRVGPGRAEFSEEREKK